MQRVPRRLQLVGALSAIMVLSVSCNSRSATPSAPIAASPSESTTPTLPPPIVAPPIETAPSAPGFLPAVRLPVEWIIDNGKAEARSDARAVHDFELPTDITKPIDDSVLPHVFVTANSHKVVIRRGTAIFGFHDETIGEHCYPAYVCLNPRCPGITEKGSAVLFPFRLLQKNGDACPYCLRTRDLANETPAQKQALKVVPYYMPQCRTLAEIMLRQHYAKRGQEK